MSRTGTSLRHPFLECLAAAVDAAPWHCLASLLAALFALAPLLAVGAEYSVSPLRINLDQETKSAVVTLTNSGSEPATFQVSAMEWTQNADGRDRYEQTADVVFFPKILTLQPGESRVVRVGVQALPVMAERTFRLFIEPLPVPAREPLAPGANISINFRFALPIFAKPATSASAGEIAAAALRKGVLTVTLRNTGNEHLRLDSGVAITGRDAQGNEVFTERIENRYVLAGAAKSLSLATPKGACERLATIEITAQSEQLTLRRTLDVDRTSCE
jgi:fimbrial chaperone protein